jgi:hypothetical protein
MTLPPRFVRGKEGLNDDPQFVGNQRLGHDITSLRQKGQDEVMRTRYQFLHFVIASFRLIIHAEFQSTNRTRA